MRLSPSAASVRARLVAAAPRVWQKGREAALFDALAGLAQAAVAAPSSELARHPLFAVSVAPPAAPLLDSLADLPAAERLVGLHELFREVSSDRRATGVYYTPPWLAELLVSRLRAPSLAGREPAHLCDPACGAGAFLVAALRARLHDERDGARRREIAERFVGGTDTDPHAIAIARTALASVVAEGVPGRPEQLVLPRLRVADPLHETESASADLVLGNPPYLDAKSRARQSPTEGAYLRDRFPELQGAFDLFAAFVLRTLELLRPGGRAALVVPDKILSAAYATGLRRRLLAETTLLEIVDLAPLRPFPEAAVFPLYVGFVRSPPPARHTVRFAALATEETLEPRADIPQAELVATSFSWRPPPRTRRALVPLGSCLQLAAGTAGFDAQALLEALCEEEEALDEALRRGDGCPFAVTGSIDRYALRAGPVRFLKHVFQRPFLPGAALDRLAEGRRTLYRAPKLVLAGMGKRLEATFVETPLALGVATYGATVRRGDPLAHLAIVNSAWASHVYLERHGERRLSGGYVTFHRRELAALPVPALTEGEERSLAALARSRLALSADAAGPERARLDASIDDEIFGILGLPASERSTISARFAQPPRRR